jgi:hypothetical protein
MVATIERAVVIHKSGDGGKILADCFCLNPSCGRNLKGRTAYAMKRVGLSFFYYHVACYRALARKRAVNKLTEDERWALGLIRKPRDVKQGG